jgi:hypothetical protein
MVVVPVDAQINEAQYVAQKYWGQWQQRLDALAMRHSQFQHHDGDDDGEDAIAKCFKSALSHSGIAPVKEISTNDEQCSHVIFQLSK